MSEAELMNDPDSVEGPDDVSFPNHTHHFKVRSELTKLVELDCLTNDEADEAYDAWKEARNA